jgi:hypothetical protein
MLARLVNVRFCVCTVCEPDIKFAVCLSTRQSERFIGIVLRVKRLFDQKTPQMRSVVAYDASKPSRHQTGSLGTLWIRLVGSALSQQAYS